jgi:4-amino-4-deoxy-L-arabinose transferase-like glycosyltransferase
MTTMKSSKGNETGVWRRNVSADRAEKLRRDEEICLQWPILTRIPIAGSVVRLLATESFYSLAALLAVLVFFTALKAPFFGLPFTGEHSMKYSSYVEPALSMERHGTPFQTEGKYATDPLKTPEGFQKEFSHLPLLEWGLFLAYRGLPAENLEAKTRWVTHIVGIFILLAAYGFLRRQSSSTRSLLFVALLAANPIFAFSTYVTVLDAFLVLFTFLSLSALNRYGETRNDRFLFVAGFLLGIGLTVKISVVLWLVPMALVLLWEQEHDFIQFLRDAALFYAPGAFVFAAFKTGIAPLPEFPERGLFLTILWGAILVLMAMYAKPAASFLEKVLRSIHQRRLLIPLFAGACFAIAVACYWLIWVRRGWQNKFLTDATLLLEWRLYSYMLFKQFLPYMTTNVFLLACAGVASAAIACTKPLRTIGMAMVVGSGTYWILASKAIFFHNYYTLILMVCACFFASGCVDELLVRLSSRRLKAVVLCFFAVLVLPRSIRETKNLLGRHEDIGPAVQFILENTKEEDLLLHEGFYTSLAISTGRGLVRPFRLAVDEVRGSVNHIGFAATMRKYKIRYLLTPFPEPRYRDFAPLFEKTSLDRPSYFRTATILARINVRNPDIETQYEDLDRIVREREIAKKFVLEKQVGKLRFYTFRD